MDVYGVILCIVLTVKADFVDALVFFSLSLTGLILSLFICCSKSALCFHEETLVLLHSDKVLTVQR